MKVLVCNEFREYVIKETKTIPVEGQKVDMFYEPYPIVKNVLL